MENTKKSSSSDILEEQKAHLKPLMRAQEVAELLNVDEKTVYMWAANGKIPAIRLNGAIRFIREDIESWINDCKHYDADQSGTNAHPWKQKVTRN